MLSEIARARHQIALKTNLSELLWAFHDVLAAAMFLGVLLIQASEGRCASFDEE